jgi:thioredoxin 1
MSGKAGIIEIESQHELRKILNEHPKVLVDFFAKWCKPCKTTHIQLQKLLEEGVLDGALVVQVDIDKNMAIAEAYNINSIPVLLLFKNGKIIKSQVGGTEMSRTRETMMKWMEL